MSCEDFLTKIIIPLVACFFGGSIAIKKYKSNKKHKMNNKKTIFSNHGDVINGNKK